MNLPNGYLLQKGKYELTQAIGQGGFGITYKGVWHTEVKGPLGAMRTEIPVCIKEYFFKDYCARDPQSLIVRVHSDTGKLLFNKFKEKLIKEAKILSDVHHPYIVNVLEVFEENNTAYIAMEYISGNSLKDKLARQGILPEKEVLHYIRQISEALQFVHGKNILHLDIKPSNILIDKDGNARLIDFGVSKRYDVGEQETSTTMLTLSKGFASIEQYDNEGIQSFSPCPDIYSLGATMYNLLTGKIPTESILRATRPLIKPHELIPAISQSTEDVILKAMEIAPADRYQSVAEMMAALSFPTEEFHADEKNERSEDETVFIGRSHADGGNESDETVLDSSSVIRNKEMKEDNGQKRKSHVPVISVLILILLGSGVYGWNWYLNSIQESSVVENDSIPSGNIPFKQAEESDIPLQAEVSEQGQVNDRKENGKEMPSGNVPKENSSDRDDKTVSPRETTEVIKNEKLVDVKTSIKEEIETINIAEASEIQNETIYNNLLASAKNKISQKKYSEALKDLSDAKKVKVTEEVVRLQIACDQELDKQKVQDRKEQYVEMMSFGSYKIVRRKSDDRYGAIDINGKEIIPCKYLSVGKTDNGRAFEREDNLFDIYGADGKVITRGATYY